MEKRLFEVKKRMSVILDAAENEKRGLTDVEKQEFDALKLEQDVLKVKLEKRALGMVDPKEVQERDAAFADMAIRMLHGADMGNYSSAMDGKAMRIVHERAAANIINTAGAAPLVPITIGEIIKPLEKGLILDKVGCKMQYGLTGDFVLPIVSGVEATIEDENAEVNDSKIDIASLKPSPKRVSLSIPVSNDAVDQTNNALRSIVIEGISKALERLLNKWQFSPTKITAKASDGVFVKTDPDLTFATTPSWKDACKLKGTILKAGIPSDGTICYVCSATMQAELESTPREAGDSRMIMEDGKINGCPVYITEYIGEDTLGCGVFSYSLIGQFGEMRLTVDPYTGVKKNVTYFVLNTKYDQIQVRKEAFAIAKKAAAGA